MALKATPLRDTILLGTSKIPVPKKLLRGYGLRRLGVLLDGGDDNCKDHKAGSPRLLQESRTVNQSAIRGSAGSTSLQRRFSAPPKSLNLRQSQRLEQATKQAITQVSPIRTLLGYSPINTTHKQDSRYCKSSIGHEHSRGHHRPNKDSWCKKRISLVPQSPRNSQLVGSSKRTPRQYSAIGVPELRSSLIQPDSPRPRTAQGRSPRAWSPENDHWGLSSSRQSGPQAAPISSPVPPLNLRGFGLKFTDSAACRQPSR